MAIQVRLDLTPSEFDLVRRALDTHKETQEAKFATFGAGGDPAERRQARAEALLTDDLSKKLRQ